jgi:hypothetical protein
LNAQQTIKPLCATIVGSSISPTFDASRGGDDVGSRVRIAAAACLVASGLFGGGAVGAIAFAELPPAPVNPGEPHTNEALGKSLRESLGPGRRDDSGDDGSVEGPKTETTRNQTTGTPRPKPGTGAGREQSGEDGEGENGNRLGGNPENGNCGNSGSNGNAQGCGGGEEDPDGEESTPTTKPTSPPTEPEKPPEEEPEEPEEPGNCDERGGGDCEPGWPWWPWEPGVPPGSGGGGGGGAEPPSGRPEPPQMQLPEELMPEPAEPTVVNAAPGLGIAAAELPLAPITLPVIVAPSIGLGGGGGGPAAPARPSLPGPPRAVTAEPPAGREPLPANVGSNVAVPASSYRVGYTDYLRSAGMSQVAALAVPGVAGMLVLTGAGGLVGYRQAKAGHAVRTGGAARFVN